MASICQTTTVSQSYRYQPSAGLSRPKSSLKLQGTCCRAFQQKLLTGTGTETIAFRTNVRFQTDRRKCLGKVQVSTAIESPVDSTLTLSKRFAHLTELTNELCAGGDVSYILESWENRLTVIDYNVLCSKLGSQSWETAWQIFNYVKEKGILSSDKKMEDKSVFNQISGTTSDVGEDTDTDNIDRESRFSDLKNANAISKLYITVLRVLINNNRSREVEELQSHLKEAKAEPDADFYNAMLDCYLNTGPMSKVSEVLAEMEKLELKAHPFLYEKAAYAYMREEPPELDYCRKIVKDFMERGHTVSEGIFNSLIKVYWRIKDISSAEEVFDLMQVAGYTPDYKVILKLAQLYGPQGKYEKIVELTERMSKWNIQPTSGMYDCLLLAYCRAGLMVEAKETFLKYKTVLNIRPPIIAFNMLIDGYGKQRLDQDALKAFEDMRENGYRPNAVSYSSVISAMVQAQRYKEADDLYARLKKEVRQPNRATYITMIRSFTKRDITREGHKIFNALKKSPFELTPTVYGAGLALYVEGAWYIHAAKLLKQIENEGVVLDAESEAVLIRSCGILGSHLTPLAKAIKESTLDICKLLSSLFINNLENEIQEDELLETLESFVQKYTGLKEKAAICNAFIDCLWRRGERSLARKVLRSWELINPQSDETLDVRGLSVGGALAAMSEWITNIGVKDASRDTKVVLIPGDESKLDVVQDNSFLRRSIIAILERLESPFVESTQDTKKLEALVTDVLEWASQEKVKDAF